MDTTALRTAYDDLLDAAELVCAVDEHVVVPSGEWDADQQLAHLIAVDAGILSVVSTTAAGAHATFDNRLSLDTHNLTRISRRAGSRAQVLKRVQARGRRCATSSSTSATTSWTSPSPPC